jgi:hypothetical protein
LSTAQSRHQAQAQQDCQTTRPQRSTNPAGGHTPAATERTTKKDIIKIGTVDVIIQENNEGPMIFGESANTTKKGIRLPSKQPIQNTPCLDGARQD